MKSMDLSSKMYSFGQLSHSISSQELLSQSLPNMVYNICKVNCKFHDAPPPLDQRNDKFAVKGVKMMYFFNKRPMDHTIKRDKIYEY